jgi:DNA repair exonuclease SbcCD ATPase subunit
VAGCLAFAAIAGLLQPWLDGGLRNLWMGGVAAAALVAFAAWLAHVRRGPPQPPAALARWFSELPPSPELLARPSELARFVERIAAVRTTLGRAREEIHHADASESTVRERTLRIAELCARLGLETEGYADQCAARLSAALGRALESQKRVEQDGAERRVAQERLDATRPGLERARDHLARIETVLRAAEPSAPTLAQAFTRVKERLEEVEFLRRREAELRRDPRFAAYQHDPRVNAQRDPIGMEWSAEATAAREQERADCARELAKAHTRLGEIANLLRSDPGGRQARIADRVRDGEERLAALKRERDRLALLESVLVHAERRFRDEHQPPVLLRASDYLSRVTGGRWSRLDFEAGAGGGLFVSGSGHDEPVRAAAPLSRGALDLIFLCLRLGLLDHLDEGREPLPLLLDDALLRMDDGRRAATYQLLREVSRRRQVFLLTCQEWIAAEAERALELRRIALFG